MPSSFSYSKPFFADDDDWEAPECPHCKQSIHEGETVHWYDSTLWHTEPCP